MKTTLGLVLGLSLAAASPAHALNQSVHYQIAVDSCRAAGGPATFCEQVGVAAHNVDDYEFNDMAAHSQMADGQTACDGANYAIWRVFWFGGQIRIAAQMSAVFPDHAHISTLAQTLGRVLHTVQDNCAHSGMPNPQHAWKSLSDVCHGTKTSPDLVPEAATCAREETDAVMDAVFSVLEDNGAEKAGLDDVEYEHNHLTNYGDACHYLGSAGTWDGVDRRWDNDIVRPFMRNEVVQAITSDNAQHEYVCSTAPDGILVGYDDDVDTSVGAPSCIGIHAFCLGKADDASEGAAAPAAMPAAGGGCDVSGAMPLGNGFLALLVGLAGLVLRRRR